MTYTTNTSDTHRAETIRRATVNALESLTAAATAAYRQSVTIATMPERGATVRQLAFMRETGIPSSASAYRLAATMAEPVTWIIPSEFHD